MGVKQVAPAVAVRVGGVGQLEVVDGQREGFAGAQRGVVHAAEERDQASPAGSQGALAAVGVVGVCEVGGRRRAGRGPGWG